MLPVEDSNSLLGPRATKIEHFATWERGVGTATWIGHCVHAAGDGAKSGAAPVRWRRVPREMVLSQAPRQRVGDECRRRLMSMLSCAMHGFECRTERSVGHRHREAKCREGRDGRVGYGSPNTNRDYYERVEGPRVRVARTADEACYRGTRIP